MNSIATRSVVENSKRPTALALISLMRRRHLKAANRFGAPFLKYCALLMLADIAALPGAARAIDAATNTQTSSASYGAQAPDTTLQEIVVTAEKVSERLQDVPASISALSADRIAQLNAHGLQDIAAFVPGLSYASSGGVGNIVLRGVSDGNSTSQLVSIVVDGAAVGSETGLNNGGLFVLDLNPADIERIEVLKGPQSTLYGATSMGGVISYITKSGVHDPLGGDLDVQGSGTAHGAGSYLADGDINLPIIEDKAALRLSAIYEYQGGFLDNALTGQKNVDDTTIRGGRATFSVAPIDTLNIKLSAVGQEKDLGASGDTIAYSFATDRPIVGPYDEGNRVLQSLKQTFDQFAANVDWNAGAINLSSITSWSKLRNRYLQDLGYDPALAGPFQSLGAATVPGFYDQITDKFAQELRISSPNSVGFRWLAGVYYNHESNTFRADFDGFGSTGEPVALLDPGIAINQPSALTSYAGFATVTVPLTSKLEIAGGLRETRDDQYFQTINSGGLIGGTDVGPRATFSEDHLDYMADVRYKLLPSTMAYFRVASGYRVGGPNVGVPGSTSFGADSLVNYEVGVKSELWDRRASLDVAAFHIDWSKIQLTALASNGFNYITNGGGAVSQGVELTTQLIPLEGLTLIGTFAYTDAHLTEDVPLLGAKDGEPLTFTPKYSGSLTAEYKYPVTSDWTGVLDATYSYTGSRTSSFSQTPGIPQFILHAYSMVGMRAGLEHGHYRITAYVRNLGNVEGETGVFNETGYAQVGVTRPREVGLDLSISF